MLLPAVPPPLLLLLFENARVQQEQEGPGILVLSQGFQCCCWG